MVPVNKHRGGGLLAIGALALAVGSLALIPSSVPVVHAAGLGAGGEFHPLNPQRIFDSRPGTSINDVAPVGVKPIGSSAEATFDISLLGKGGIPASSTEVLAAVVSVTVTEPSGPGYLGAYPAGNKPANPTSLVNYNPGQSVSDVGIVRPGNGGNLTITLGGAGGTAHVVVDVFGWFSTSSSATAGSRLIPVTPGRILDTRNTGAMGAGSVVTLPIRGADATNPTVTDIVPNTANVVGVLLNVTGISPSQATFVSVVPETPAPGTAPSTSNVNLLPGQFKANLVFAPLGADGAVRLYNLAGTNNVAVDVMGYLIANQDPNTRAGRVIPLDAPFRVLDTRQAQWGSVPLGPGQAEDWSFADFTADVNIGGVAVGNQSAVLGTFTQASLGRQFPSVYAAGYMSVYPSDAPSQPVVSNLNSVEGAAIPNMAIAKYSGSKTARVFNKAGFAHYIFDASAIVLAD